MSDQQFQSAPAAFAEDVFVPEDAVSEELDGVRELMVELKALDAVDSDRFGNILAAPIVSKGIDRLAHAKFVKAQIEKRIAFEKELAVEQDAFLESLKEADSEIIEKAQAFQEVARTIGSLLGSLGGIEGRPSFASIFGR